MIYVIGDSHAETLANVEGFRAGAIGAATAHNLISDHSYTHSKKIIMDALPKVGAEDKVILIFGEIDCRLHIYNEYMKAKQTKPLENYIEATIQRYGQFLKLLQERKGLDFAVMTIPPAGYQLNMFNLPYYASQRCRAEIHKVFNEKLILFCQENNIKVIDIYDKVATADGMIKMEYSRDEVHLNKKVAPFVIEELRKKGMWTE